MKIASIKNVAFAGGLYLLTSCSSLVTSPQITEMNHEIKTNRIHHEISSVISKRGKGFDSDIFFSTDSTYYTSEDVLQKLEDVNREEKKTSFISLSPLEKDTILKQSIDNIIITTYDNIHLLKRIDTLSAENRTMTENELSYFLTFLNENPQGRMYKSKVDKLKEAYNFLQDNLKMVLISPDIPDTISMKSNRIDSIIAGAAGNCNDLVPAYFAFLNYAGFNTSIRISAISYKGNKLYHAYLGVYEDKTYFELDPMLYYNKGFIPIEERNENAVEITVRCINSAHKQRSRASQEQIHK